METLKQRGIKKSEIIPGMEIFWWWRDDLKSGTAVAAVRFEPGGMSPIWTPKEVILVLVGGSNLMSIRSDVPIFATEADAYIDLLERLDERIACIRRERHLLKSDFFSNMEKLEDELHSLYEKRGEASCKLTP